MARKTKEEALKTRVSLLKAALRVFSRQGYTATTLEDVAHEAGVTRGAIYWHFGSKAELYLALMNEYSDRGSNIVQAAAAEGGGLVVILRRVFVRLLEAVESDPELREMMEISLFKTERSTDLQDALAQRTAGNRQLIDSIAAVMRQGIDSQDLRTDMDPYEMSRAFLGLQNGLIYMWLQDRGSFSLKESAPNQADNFFNGILRREAK